MVRVAVICGFLLWTCLGPDGDARARADSPGTCDSQCGGGPATYGPSPETCAAPSPQPAGPKVVIKVPRQIEVQQPAATEAAAPAGVYVAPAQTGVFQGPTRAYGIEGMVITLPQLQLKLPSIQFPSFFVARRNARLITDSAEAPYVVTGTQTMQGAGGGTAVVATASAGTTNLVTPQPTLAAPAYVAGAPQTVGLATTYPVGPPAAYALASPDAAAAAGSLPPGRWVLIQGPAGQAARATGQPRAPGDAEDLEAKFRELLEREQHLQDRIEELQRYIQQRDLQGSAVPACPPAPMPQPDCGSQSEAGRGSVIQQSVYREPVPAPAGTSPYVTRLPRVE
jgi:hypothetical protein